MWFDGKVALIQLNVSKNSNISTVIISVWGRMMDRVLLMAYRRTKIA
jgi:hypothetical protein